MRRTLVTATLTVLVLVVLASVYGAAGWRRAEAACGREDVAPAGVSGWSQGWTWLPPGFTCEYDDGTVERSLWW